jgi:hypothetical protein
MTNISADQLRRAAQIKDQIESLESELSKILGGGGNGVPSPARRGRPAKVADVATQGMKPKRKMSAAGRAKIAAAAKARWAKAKAAGKNSL